MAVYTDIDEEELEAFLAAYPVGDLLSYRGIAEGVENSNFLLHAETDGAPTPYILTLYERRVAEADLPFFLGLMGHLAERGLACPLPIPRHDGKLLGRLADRPAALISFLEGFWLRRPRREHARELGAAMARMHVAGADFPLTRANALAPDAWEPLYRSAGPEAGSVSPTLRADVEETLEAVERDWPRDLPQGVIHADLFPDNAFFLHDRFAGMIDFYFACNDLFAYDLAIALNAWCFERDGAFNVTMGRALLAGYCSERMLDDGEVAALPILARGAALRFLLTRLWDWLHIPDGGLVKKKDPLEYLAKLRHHATVRTPADFGWTDEIRARVAA